MARDYNEGSEYGRMNGRDHVFSHQGIRDPSSEPQLVSDLQRNEAADLELLGVLLTEEGKKRTF